MLSIVALTAATASVTTGHSVHLTGVFTCSVHQDTVTCWFDEACSQWWILLEGKFLSLAKKALSNKVCFNLVVVTHNFSHG